MDLTILFLLLPYMESLITNSASVLHIINIRLDYRECKENHRKITIVTSNESARSPLTSKSGFSGIVISIAHFHQISLHGMTIVRLVIDRNYPNHTVRILSIMRFCIKFFYFCSDSTSILLLM